ncbi:MAG TPA: hypothetical protein VMU92_14360 [Acidobacteriaceae bacterium]|nr:hypothetical protein [Acidobacteriaceae bacterium]
MTFQYQLWGYRINSEFDLGELDPVCGDATSHGDLDVRRAEDEEWIRQRGAVLLEDRHENGEVSFACWKRGDGYVAQFPGVCSFLILPDEMRVEIAPGPGLGKAATAHMVLDHAIPRLLTLKPGHIVLHASAIAMEGHVVAVLGISGQGKSTLAAWLASQGHPVLTDDCLVLRWDEEEQEWLAQPSYESVRLWPDSVDALGINKAELREFAEHSPKMRTGKEAQLHFATEGAPLRGCFALVGEEGKKSKHKGPPAVCQLPVKEAFVALMGSVFRLDAENEQINRREFEVMTRLTERVRFWSLAYERKYDWLPDVQRAMIDALQSGSDE